MRFFYFMIIVALILIVTLFVGTLLYFEKTSHKNFQYIISEDENIIGSAVINKYVTEKSNIFKSRISTPLDLNEQKKEIRMEFDKRTGFLYLYEEYATNIDITTASLIKRHENNMSYLGIAYSKFVYLDNIGDGDKTYVIENKNIASFVPFISYYNFKKGGAQFFNAIILTSTLDIPILADISLTSIRDDYIDIDGKKVKTELLILKSEFLDETRIWVDKRHYTIVRVELNDKKLCFARTYSMPDIEINAPFAEQAGDINQKVIFNTGEREYNGLLSRPRREDSFPAIIIVPGEKDKPLEPGGIFNQLSSYLSANGYVVLRYKANSGIIQKNIYDNATIGEQNKSIEKAVELLANYRFVEPDKIFVLCHSDSAFSIMPYLVDTGKISGAIFLSPKILYPISALYEHSDSKKIEKILSADKTYEERLKRAEDLTVNIANGSDKNNATLAGEKVFTGKVREILNLKGLESIPDLNIPILILQGKKTDAVSAKFTDYVNAYVQDHGTAKYTTIFFTTLDENLGAIKKPDSAKQYIELNKEIPETIHTWLDQQIKESEQVEEKVQKPIEPAPQESAALEIVEESNQSIVQSSE